MNLIICLKLIKTKLNKLKTQTPIELKKYKEELSLFLFTCFILIFTLIEIIAQVNILNN